MCTTTAVSGPKRSPVSPCVEFIIFLGNLINSRQFASLNKGNPTSANNYVSNNLN